MGGSDSKLVYRHYATLYFVVCVDSSESELGILDLIQAATGAGGRRRRQPARLSDACPDVCAQVFVETLDSQFENVCELDLIFHVERVYFVLDEIVMGGMVLETNSREIQDAIDAQAKVRMRGVRACASRDPAR